MTNLVVLSGLLVGRDVTAMPFGIDTPSMFGFTFGVIGPTMLLTKDPWLAWKVGMGATIAMGLVKLVLSFAGDWVRRVVPRAGLLGSIAGVAILLIAFLPALTVFADPLVGLVSLGMILVTLVGRIGHDHRPAPGCRGRGVRRGQRRELDGRHPLAARERRPRLALGVASHWPARLGGAYGLLAGLLLLLASWTPALEAPEASG